MCNDLLSLGTRERKNSSVILPSCDAFCFHFGIQVTCVGCMPHESLKDGIPLGQQAPLEIGYSAGDCTALQEILSFLLQTGA